tara:strand:+ start:2695 stop:3609 length:915 start_codon:yes stop_codon:yes gene_type:complete
MDKIVFFSESGVMGRIPRDFENARTEYAWMLALEAPHYTLGTKLDENFDLGIVIIPKSNPQVDLDFYRKNCKNVAVMQEGPHWYFQDYPIPHQFNYANTIVDADWIYCHNKSDIKYYKGLGCKDVRVMRSLMIPDGLKPTEHKSNGTMIGGNFVQWYGGFDSYVVARSINHPITAPSMGRKQEDEDLIEDITYLPYMNWRDWINMLGNYRIGVHLMRTHAAGTFSMNCAFHGIPSIGYKGLDTQELLHPHTTIEVGDLLSAKKIIERLDTDKDFYEQCSRESKENFEKHYSEEAWLENWKKTNE